MNWGKRRSWRSISILLIVQMLVLLMAQPSPAQAQAPAGYSEYYISGSEEQMWAIFYDLDPYNLVIGNGMHAVISVTASTDNTTIYYDHWENGYNFDPGTLQGADETYPLSLGGVQVFESANIPVNPRGTAIYYDGRDRLYAVGGAVTVSRASWSESGGTLFAQAWETFPTHPYQNLYTIPVGENLAGAPDNYADFTKSYVIVQSTADNNTVQIDDPGTPLSPDVSATLNRGEVTQLYHIDSGTIISATYPVQAQLIVGNNYGGTRHYESRDFTLVPTGLWDTAYYSPVGGFGGGIDTELYVYNPYTTTLTVGYEDSLGSGNFDISAGSTRSYSDGAGRTVPIDSGVYLSASQSFWAIGVADTESTTYDWGLSLVPEFALTSEYYLGWAPGTSEANPTANGSPAFVTPAQDGTTVFVDYSPTDGVVDATYALNRLETQKIFDPDNQNTAMHIWATRPIAVAWGEDPDTAGTAYPYLDMGNTTLPLQQDWMDIVLELDKSANPSIIPAGAGQRVTFTLAVNSYQFDVSDVDIVDNLPPGWTFIYGSATITLPDNSQISGAAANPLVTGQDLTWDLNQAMAPNQSLTVVFTAEITGALSASFSQNNAQASGSRGSQLFTAHDTAQVYISNLSMRKTSSAGGSPVDPGDTITYTVVISNPGGVPATNISVSDALPANTSYVSGSSRVQIPVTQSGTFRDEFNAVAYNGSNGTLSWATDWMEVGEADGPAAGDVLVISNLNNNRLRVRDNDNGGEGARREANLAVYTSATLSFDYRRNNLNSVNDYVALSVSADGGGSWTELARFQGPTNDAGFNPVQYDLTPYLAANTQVRLLSSPTLGNNEQVYFDNVQIEAFLRTLANNPGGALPDLVLASDGYRLLPGETMTVTYAVIIDDPMPTDVTIITNTAYVYSDQHRYQALQDTVSDPVSNPTAIGLTSFSAISTRQINLAGSAFLAILASCGLAGLTGWRTIRRKLWETAG